jgi:hypothetical protein
MEFRKIRNNQFLKFRYLIHLVHILKIAGLAVGIFLLVGSKVWGQTTISSDGLENTSTVFTITGGGTYYSGNSASGDRVASSPFAAAGTYSYGITNGTATLTSGNINTSAYANISMNLRLAAFSIGATNRGVDYGDNVIVEVSPNGGTNYYNTITVTGSNGNTNSWWSYAGGTGIASTAYDGDATTVTFQPANNGNRTVDGYSTITITNLPSATNLRIRITADNNATNERYCIDDFRITGTRIYYSNGNNPANSLTSWWTNTNGTGSNPADFTSGDVLLVQGGHNMTTTGSWLVSGTNSKVQISNNASITASDQITFSAATTFQIDNGGSYNHNNTTTTVWGGTESLGATSTVNYQFAGTQNVEGLTYGNLTISGSNSKTLTNNITVNNNLSITGSATLASDVYQITGNATGAFTMAAGTELTLGNAGSAIAVPILHLTIQAL